MYIQEISTKFSIFSRLIISNFLIILLISIISIYIIIYLNNLNSLIESVIKHDTKVIKIVEYGLDDLYSMSAADDKYLISGDVDYFHQFDQIRSDLNQKVKELSILADIKEKKDLLADIEKYQSQFNTLLEERKSPAGNRVQSAKINPSYINEREEIIVNIDNKLNSLLNVSIKERDWKLQQSREMTTQIANISIISGVIVIILGIFITFINARKINKPIKLLQEKTKDVASGKFEETLEIASPPEIRELADSFNVMCERLKEMDQMKIDYISHLSHELRTPLTVIKEASLMLQQGVFSRFPAKQEELFNIVNEECERLITSVNRILDFSRMEAGKMSFSFQQADISQVIERSVIKIMPLLQNKKINIIKEVQNIPPVAMDMERIEEVLENLLSNAWKYTPAEGTIKISAINNVEKGIIEISIKDNGIGIPEDRLQQVFDKFKRVDNRRGAIRGTGLGLAIVRHIINNHGGRIWVKSKVGEGSTFTFSLPVS
ncbi:MAG: HAMP domain-containing sensor histidine kinase [Smithella sp.]